MGHDREFLAALQNIGRSLEGIRTDFREFKDGVLYLTNAVDELSEILKDVEEIREEDDVPTDA
jgi:hypothetical protein